jgi:hypothetical protein
MTSPATPEILYHYTGQLGLQGILTNQSIWASHVQFLNDGSEMTLCLDLVKSHLHTRPDFESSTVTGRALRCMEDWTSRIDGPSIFVASFTERGDLLSQWRGYCKPGDAYSIAVSRSVIETAVDPAHGAINPFWRLTRCLYDEVEQVAAVAKHVEEHIQRLSARLDAFPGEDLDRQINSAGWAFAVELMQLAPAIKDNAFEEEQEWRLVSARVDHPSVRVHFRPGKHTLVPYFDLPLPGLSAAHPAITVGPSPYPKLSVQGVALLAQSLGIEYGPIAPSAIPFRDW